MTHYVPLLTTVIIGQIALGPWNLKPNGPAPVPGDEFVQDSSQQPLCQFGAVAGQVRGIIDDQGRSVPLPGALVQLFHDGQLVREVQTGRDGWYVMGELRPGRYGVLARAEGFLPEDAQVFIESDALARQDFLLRPGPPPGAIFGQVRGVTDEGEIPLGGALVRLWHDGQVVREVRTNDDGWYGMDEVPPGEYGMEARAEGFQPEERRVVVEPGEETRQDFLLDPAPPPGAIFGQVRGVTDEGEIPLVGALVRVWHDGQLVREVETGDEGWYELGEIPPGRYRVVARAHGFVPQGARVFVRAGRPTRQDFVLRRVPAADGP